MANNTCSEPAECETKSRICEIFTKIRNRNVNWLGFYTKKFTFASSKTANFDWYMLTKSEVNYVFYCLEDRIRPGINNQE